MSDPFNHEIQANDTDATIDDETEDIDDMEDEDGESMDDGGNG